MIIDAHAHLGMMQGRMYTPEDLLASMKEVGIEYSFVITNSTPNDDNNAGLRTDEVVAIAQRYSQLQPIGAIEIDRFGETQIANLKDHLHNKRILGIKFFPGYDGYYPNDPRFTSLYEFCQKEGYPVVYHTGFLETGYEGDQEQAHPKHITAVADAFPTLRIVIAHVGNPWIEDCAKIVKKYEYVYSDISALGPTEYDHISQKDELEMRRLLTSYKMIAGDFTKCLFGTDYPIYSQKEYIDVIQKIAMAAHEKDLIFSGNAIEIFKPKLV